MTSEPIKENKIEHSTLKKVQPEKPADKRKKYLTDKKYQLKNTFSTVGLYLIPSLLIVGFILLTASSSQEGFMKKISALEDSIQTQDGIVKGFIKYSQSLNLYGIKLRTDDITSDHDRSMGVIRDNVEILKHSAARNTQIIIVIALVTALQSIFFFRLNLKRTNRISGPARIMNDYITRFLSRKKTVIRQLRKGDELQSLHDNLVLMITRLTEEKEKEKKKKQKEKIKFTGL